MLNDDGNAFLIRNLIWINAEVVLVLIRTVNLKEKNVKEYLRHLISVLVGRRVP